MKILHIDDEEPITDVMGTFLQIQGYDYESTSNGTEGLKLIKKNHYDIILLDLNMPEFSGFDVIDTMVNDDMIKDQKIVIFSAVILSSEQMIELRKKEINSIIQKQVMNDNLLKRLKLIEKESRMTINVR